MTRPTYRQRRASEARVEARQAFKDAQNNLKIAEAELRLAEAREQLAHAKGDGIEASLAHLVDEREAAVKKLRGED